MKCSAALALVFFSSLAVTPAVTAQTHDGEATSPYGSIRANAQKVDSREAGSGSSLGGALMVAGGILAVPVVESWRDFSDYRESTGGNGPANPHLLRAVGWTVAAGSAFGAGLRLCRGGAPWLHARPGREQ